MIDTAMILAAGRGTRLGPYGEVVPKALAEVHGAPLLEHQLAYLGRQGVRRVVVNVHHLPDQMLEFASAYGGDVQVETVVEPELTGTAGAVRASLSRLGDAFLVLYGDVVVQEPLEGLLATHTAGNRPGTMAVYATDVTHGKGLVECDASGAVSAFLEKPAGHTGTALVNAGVYVLDRTLFDAVPGTPPVDFGFDLFPAALRAGEALGVHRLDRPVIDIGTPEALHDVNQQAYPWP
jgi:mannose-1-phosphate guanylyltransferase